MHTAILIVLALSGASDGAYQLNHAVIINAAIQTKCNIFMPRILADFIILVIFIFPSFQIQCKISDPLGMFYDNVLFAFVLNSRCDCH